MKTSFWLFSCFLLFPLSFCPNLLAAGEPATKPVAGVKKKNIKGSKNNGTPVRKAELPEAQVVPECRGQIKIANESMGEVKAGLKTKLEIEVRSELANQTAQSEKPDSRASEAVPNNAKNSEAESAKPGFFDKVSSFFGAMPKKTVLSGLGDGSYVKSNIANGEERDVESRRVENLGLVAIAQYQTYANAIYECLKKSSGVSKIPGKIYLLAAGDLIATSTADGNIFLSIGWIRTIESEEELAALLAHELSHVLLHHHDSTMFSRWFKQAQYLLTTGLAVVKQVEKASGGTDNLAPNQIRALQQIQLLIDTTDIIALPAWNRREELAADRLAVDLLASSNYPQSGLNDLFAHMKSWEDKQEASRKALAEKLDENMKVLAEQGKLGDALKIGLMNSVSDFKKIIATKHDDADTRLTGVAEYFDKLYADHPDIASRPNSYAKLLTLRSTKAILDGYQKTFSAIVDLKEGKIEQARLALQDVVKAGAVHDHGLPNYQLFLANRASNDADAIKQLERCFTAPEPIWKPVAEAMRILARKGERDRALQLAQEARSRFKDTPALLPELVGIYTDLNFKEQANQALNSCKLNYPEYRDHCKERSKKQL